MTVPPPARRTATTAVAAALTLAILLLLPLSPGRSALGQLDAGGTAALPCEDDTTMFPRDVPVAAGTTIIEQWTATYNATVDKIIEAHLAQIQAGGKCDPSDVEAPATKELQALATQLGKGKVHEDDMPGILIDYLHGKYECAIESEELAEEPNVANDLVTQNGSSTGGGDAGSTDGSVNVANLNQAADAEQTEMEQDITVSEGALRRTLTYLSGYARIQPLRDALQCLAGATQDIKNNFDLMGQISARMPRIWNARTSLRTLSSQ